MISMKSFIFTLLIALPLWLKGQELTMMVINPTQINDQLVYDVVVFDFIDVVGYQIGYAYDTNNLRNPVIQDFNLPFLDADNFATNDPGFIENVWLDNSLNGVTVSDSTVIYRIAFDLVGSELGSVCFSLDSIHGEFVNSDNELFSVYIVDDCHDTLFLLIDHTSGLENVALDYGLKVTSLNMPQSISIHLEKEMSLAFSLYDLKGVQVQSFASKEYSPGTHTLDMQKPVTPGLYLLSTVISGRQVTLKVIIH